MLCRNQGSSALCSFFCISLCNVNNWLLYQLVPGPAMSGGPVPRSKKDEAGRGLINTFCRSLKGASLSCLPPLGLQDDWPPHVEAYQHLLAHFTTGNPVVNMVFIMQGAWLPAAKRLTLPGTSIWSQCQGILPPRIAWSIGLF